MVRHFLELCRRRCMRVKADKGKRMVLGGEEGSLCEVLLNGTRLEGSE